eukprot:GHVP01012284.1.p1 GENE.GHVP01012284.1~~GHVP01012284.1.p1  ORF type:complete len:549 (+),score=89.58 GHVP01012284.1:62-1648(+)
MGMWEKKYNLELFKKIQNKDFFRMENFQASLFFLPFNTFQDFQLENSLTEGNHFNDFLDLRKSTSSWNWKIGTACVSGIILAAVAKVYFSRQTLEESRVYGSQTPSTQETAPPVTHGLSGGADETSKSGDESTSTHITQLKEMSFKTFESIPTPKKQKNFTRFNDSPAAIIPDFTGSDSLTPESKDLTSSILLEEDNFLKVGFELSSGLKDVNLNLIEKYKNDAMDEVNKESPAAIHINNWINDVNITEVAFAAKLLFGPDWEEESISKEEQEKMIYAIWLRVSCSNSTCLKDDINWKKLQGCFYRLREKRMKAFSRKTSSLFDKVALRINKCLYDPLIDTRNSSKFHVELSNRPNKALGAHDMVRIRSEKLDIEIDYLVTGIRIKADASEKVKDSVFSLGCTESPVNSKWLDLIVRILGSVVFTEANFNSIHWNCRAFSFLMSKGLLGESRFADFDAIQQGLFSTSNRLNSVQRYTPIRYGSLATKALHERYGICTHFWGKFKPEYPEQQAHEQLDKICQKAFKERY